VSFPTFGHPHFAFFYLTVSCQAPSSSPTAYRRIRPLLAKTTCTIHMSWRNPAIRPTYPCPAFIASQVFSNDGYSELIKEPLRQAICKRISTSLPFASTAGARSSGGLYFGVSSSKRSTWSPCRIGPSSSTRRPGLQLPSRRASIAHIHRQLPAYSLRTRGETTTCSGYSIQMDTPLGE
jgi:hypothetical protein